MSAETANGDNAAYQGRHAREDRHAMAVAVQPRRYKPAPRPSTDRDTLNDIERRDPDGFSHTQPTRGDLRAHKNWAVNKHGQQAWNDYKKGGWAPQPEV